jgi:RNA methyltransferase, TrmH family
MPLTKAEAARLRSLRDKKAREATGLFVVEGPKVVGELLAAGHEFAEVYATPEWQPDRPDAPDPGNIPVTRVTAAEMARISHFPTPSTVLAVGKIEPVELTPGELDHGYTLALDGVQDPGNVGTLLRIADWFALDRVLLSPDCADLFSQKVINASMGSFSRVRAIRTALIPALEHTDVTVFGCELSGDNVYTWAAPAAAVIVIGSEGRGLSAEVTARVNRCITIPRLGGAESLNAAVAAGIICAQLRRPR